MLPRTAPISKECDTVTLPDRARNIHEEKLRPGRTNNVVARLSPIARPSGTWCSVL
jgi:hypothetical protein